VKPLKHDSFENIEQEKRKQSAKKIKKIDWMRPEKWKDLTKEQKNGLSGIMVKY
jgi:hypothetical protein